MWIDLTCPLDLRGTAIRQDSCEILLCNLGSGIVTDVELTISSADAAGEEIERHSRTFRNIDGRTGVIFALQSPLDEPERAAALTVVVDRLWYSDSRTWRRVPGSLTEYEPNDLPWSPELSRLQLQEGAGRDAVGYPALRDNCWLCICGRPNDLAAMQCARCGRDRESMFARLNREAVMSRESLKANLRRERSRETLNRESQRQEGRMLALLKKRQTRRRWIAGISAVIVCGALAYGGIFHLAPLLRYSSAVRTMENGGYAEARDRFLAMGDYRDAPALAERARFLADESAVHNGGEAELRAARADLAQRTGDAEAQDLLREADLRLARILLGKGDGGSAREARTLLNGLDETPETAALLQQADYRAAAALLKDGEYEEAEAAFLALGAYEDAAEQAKECVYRSAQSALSFGDREGAIGLLERIAGYRDADTLRSRTWYELGAAREAAGDLAAAGTAYLQAGDYQDAAEKAGACLYPAAEEARAAGDNALAASRYGLIPGYLDAREKYLETAYAGAEQALKEGSPEQAEALLLTLPDSYEDTLQLRQEAIYLRGQAALERSDYQAAIDFFSRISTYRDSADNLLDARYWLAKQKEDTGDWPGALALYRLTTGHGDTAKRLQVVRYQYALQLLNEGSYQAAAEQFQAAGRYNDAPDRLKEARYALAGEKQAAGVFAEAAELYGALGDYRDAAAQARTCSYARAGQLAEAGSLREAADLYAAVGDWEDAPARARGLYLTLAREAEAAGQSLNAARLYTLAGDEADAAARAEACFDAYYGAGAAEAQEALARGEYELVLTLLENMDLRDLPAKYAALADCRREANYRLALAREDAGDVYGALPYWQAIPGYQDADSRLSRLCYTILGVWTSEKGRTYIFCPDGTCWMADRRMYFAASENTVNVGEAPDRLRDKYTASAPGGSRIRLRNGNLLLRLTRQGDAPDTAPETDGDAPAGTPAEGAPDSYLVVDDE